MSWCEFTLQYIVLSGSSYVLGMHAVFVPTSHSIHEYFYAFLIHRYTVSTSFHRTSHFLH